MAIFILQFKQPFMRNEPLIIIEQSPTLPRPGPQINMYTRHLLRNNQTPPRPSIHRRRKFAKTIHRLPNHHVHPAFFTILSPLLFAQNSKSYL